MKSTLISETIWLNDTEVCSLEYLADTSGLTIQELNELVELGALQPVNHNASQVNFRMQSIVIARQARRLRDDLDLDLQGLAVAINLLERIRSLENQLSQFRTKMQGSDD